MHMERSTCKRETREVLVDASLAFEIRVAGADMAQRPVAVQYECDPAQQLPVAHSMCQVTLFRCLHLHARGFLEERASAQEAAMLLHFPLSWYGHGGHAGTEGM